MPKVKKVDFKPLIQSVKKRVKEAKKKGKTIKVNITTAHLLKKWNEQGGICPLCGMQLDLRGKTHHPGITPDMRATVDRIDWARGYVRGNVALLHHVCNRFKGRLDGNIVYAVARRIVERFEQLYPNTKAEIDTQLKETVDQRAYLYPRFSYFGSGSGGKLGGSADAEPKPKDNAGGHQ